MEAGTLPKNMTSQKMTYTPQTKTTHKNEDDPKNEDK